MFKWPGGPRKTFPKVEGSLKYLFVYLKVRIFKCSYRNLTGMCPAQSGRARLRSAEGRKLGPDPVEPISVDMGSWLGSVSQADEDGCEDASLS